MFHSISNVEPGSTVTTSFTASETCQIVIPNGNYTVEKNGTPVVGLTIDLQAGDVIALSLPAPGNASDKEYIPYTYNGVESIIGISTVSSDSKPKVKNEYQNLVWTDHTLDDHNASVLDMQNLQQHSFELAAVMGGGRAVPLAGILDPLTKSVYFVDANGNVVTGVTLPYKPIYSTATFNSTSSEYEFWILTEGGHIYRVDRSFNLVKSSAIFPYAKTIFTDGSYLCTAFFNVGTGMGHMVRFSDINTFQEYQATGWTGNPILHGIASPADTFWYLSDGDKVIKQQVGAMPTVLDTGQAGYMTWMQSRFYIPYTDQYKVKSYNVDGVLQATLDLGNYLPYQCTSDRYYVYISCYNSPDILRWDGLSNTYKVFKFDQKVTQVAVAGSSLIASHYLETIETTYNPVPDIGVLVFPSKKASVGSKVGTGYLTFESSGGPSDIETQDGVVAWIDGVKGNQIQGGQTLSVSMEAVSGKRSLPIAIDSLMVDYVVEGVDSDSQSLNITPPFQPLPTNGTNEVIFNIELPTLLAETFVSTIIGDIMINGMEYHGQFTVDAGDQISVKVKVPEGVNYYYSILSVAGSDFLLPISNTPVTEVAIEWARPFLDNNTETTFTIGTLGEYTLPELRNASLSIDGVPQTSFPVLIGAGSQVTIRHTTTSFYAGDRRHTFLLGPENFVVISDTNVDDIPDYMDFGILSGAIPDQEYFSTSLIASGLSPDYKTTLYAKEGILISTDGINYNNPALVGNGDEVRLKWKVTNLWTPEVYLYVLLNSGVTEYNVGVWHVLPPDGANSLPVAQQHESFGEWVDYEILSSAFIASTPPSQPMTVSGPLMLSGANDAFAISDSKQAVSDLIRRGTKTASSAISRSTRPGQRRETVISSRVSLSTDGKSEHPNSMPTSDAPIVGFTSRSEPVTSTIGSVAEYSSPKVELGDPPISSTDGLLVEVHQLLQYDPDPEFLGLHVGTQYLPKPLFQQEHYEAVYNPRPSYLKENFVRNYLAKPTYGTPVVYRYVQPVWQKVIVAFVVTDPKPVYENPQPYRNLEPNPSYSSPNRQELVDLVPYRTIGSIMNVNLVPKMVLNNSGKSLTIPVHGKFAVDPLTVSDDYQKLGGFATEEEALATGLYYAGNMPFFSYQQPEGTFSYIINRKTELVCPIRTSNLYVKAWLLGGG